MNEINVIGIDLAKNIFELCAVSASGSVVWTKRLKRRRFMTFMTSEAPRCIVGMEACGGAHHWGRVLSASGFDVRLLPARSVKAYRQGVHKNDARDARAIAEAASRGHVAPVRVKGQTSQVLQALVRIRARRSRQLTQTVNQLRGVLNEFGLIAPKGRRRLLERIAAFERDGLVPITLAPLVDTLRVELEGQKTALDDATADLVAWVRDDEVCRRLMTIPHIGPINAATLSVALDVPEDFTNGRAFAAQLGLVPRQIRSADSNRSSGIARQSANDTRVYLVLAAQSLLTAAKRNPETPSDGLLAWARQLCERKHRNVAAVAVAAKLSRIAWAVVAGETQYRPRTAS